MKKILVLLALAVLMLTSVGAAAAAGPGYMPASTARAPRRVHVLARLHPVGGSHVSGFVDLRQLSMGTHISVLAFGLRPGGQYLSIYYDNATCTLASDSIPDDVIGYYRANRFGIGRTSHNVDDDLSMIHSVSVRRNDANHTLLACARVP